MRISPPTHQTEVRVPTAVFSPEVQAVFDSVSRVATKQVRVGTETKTIQLPFPSPEDWRDQWIYFLMVDRFNNPTKPPASALVSSRRLAAMRSSTDSRSR